MNSLGQFFNMIFLILLILITSLEGNARDIKASSGDSLNFIIGGDTKFQVDSSGNILFPGLTVDTVPYIGSSGEMVSSAITPTELGYLTGVTSAIQGQINAVSGGVAGAATRELDNLNATSINQDLIPQASKDLGSAANKWLELHASSAFLEKLTVVSTIDSSTPCPSMTEAERDLIGAPGSGSCIFNNTSFKQNFYNGSGWEAIASGSEFVDVTTSQSIAGVKTFTGRLATSSTTAASKPCPVMTEAQRDAIGAPEAGDCVFNATSAKQSNFNGATWADLEADTGGAATYKLFTYAENLTAGDPAYIFDDGGLEKVGLADYIPPTVWTDRSDVAGANSWQGVAFGGGIYIAIESAGTVMKSTDGETWVSATTTGVTVPKSIAYGAGLFVVTGDNSIATSPLGVTWTSRTSPANRHWDEVKFLNNQFIAVGTEAATDAITTSPFGVTWTIRNGPTSNGRRDVAFGKGIYIITRPGSNSYDKSVDNGVTWTDETFPVSGLASITFGGGLFVALSDGAMVNAIATSDDGSTWESHDMPDTRNWDRIIYGNGLFLAIARQGYTDLVGISRDGKSWEIISNGINGDWRGSVYAQGQFVIVASTVFGSIIQVQTSPFAGNGAFDVFGVIQTTGIAGTVGPVAIMGETSGVHVGQISGSKAYSQDNGTISSDTGGTLMGRYISPTELRLTKTP